MIRVAPDVLAAIGISIVAAAAFALLVRGARQPLILGYILAGAALGPHVGLGVVTDERSIELISETGLILLLFIVGLELSVPRVLQAGRTIVASGLLQFPLCAALAWFAFHDRVARGGAFDGLYLAVALGLSSTLIVVKLLTDRLQAGTFAGRVTLGILIFQDLWAIAFLALQPNLAALEPLPLLRSFAAGALLVALAALLSRHVLPGLFRAIAGSHELMLICAVAWCFLLAGTAGAAGLSKEMGALIAGMTIAAFPYGTEVTSRLSGVRDFFVTLFFVALGLKIPLPPGGLVPLTLAAAGFVVLSRFLTIVPIFTLLRVDTRSAGVVAANLAQVSEFSLVIVSLGTEYGHISADVSALVLYTLLVTAVVSTYGIRFNHEIGTALARALAGLGMPRWRRPAPETGAGPPPASAAGGGAGRRPACGPSHDVFLLGVSREGLALLQRLQRESPEMKRRIVAVDFNPETLERLQADGVRCHYGDIANIETLRHAGIEAAAVAVSSISDWFLQGTDNLTLLRLVRRLAPQARVLVTADTLSHATALYAEGADYVLLPSALAAEELCRLLLDPRPSALREARRRQAPEMFGG